jgi:hypothetical protein
VTVRPDRTATFSTFIASIRGFTSFTIATFTFAIASASTFIIAYFASVSIILSY